MTNGARLETYTIAGERGSGVLGAAAHLIHVGDLVILIAYASLSKEEIRAHMPTVVHVDSENKVIALGSDPVAGASLGLLRSPFLS